MWAAVEVAKAVAAHNNKVARAALVDTISKGKYLERKLVKARTEQARSAAAKVKVEGELAVFKAQREIQLLDDRIELAERQVKLAESAVRSILLEGERAIQRVAVDASVVQGELQAATKQVALAEVAVTATRLDGKLAIQSAMDSAEIAKIEARFAKQRHERAKQELDQAQKKIGIQVPVDEFIFLPKLPVRVHEIKVAVGDEAKGHVLTVTDNNLSIDSSLALNTAQLVKVGMEVLIDEKAVGARAKGRISYVADTPGTRGVDAYHRYINVDVLEANMPIAKYSLRLTIPIKSTAGKKIVVPVNSLSLATDGSSQLQVQRNGTLEIITVEPGLSADGFVEVIPVDGEIQAGQLVVVGFEYANNRSHQ